MQKQRLSCVTTSIVLDLAFLPSYSCHALERMLYIYSHPHSIYYIVHIHSLALSFLSHLLPHGGKKKQLLLSLPELMPADEG